MKKRFIALLARLGFTDKAKNNQLTAEETSQLNAECVKELGMELKKVMEKITSEQNNPDSEMLSQISSLLAENTDTEEDDEDDDETNAEGEETEDEDDDDEEPEAKKKGQKNLLKKVNSIVGANKKMQQQIKTLAERQEPATPKRVLEGKKIVAFGGAHTASHLFGVTGAAFELAKPWNARAAKHTAPTERYSEDEREMLFRDFNAYGKELSSRYAHLHTNGLLGVLAAGNMDYSELESDLGAYYRVRRQDAIIDRIRQLPSIASIFPVVYNIQDEQAMVDVFASGSFTQAYQAGRVFSGGFAFEPQKAKVKDVMFKYLFSDLKDLETQYIGYLNQEGSDPIKWAFIEWIMMKCAIIQHNEKELRRVKGYRVESTTGKAAHFMYASTGFLHTVEDQYEKENRVYVFPTKRAYTKATILDYVRAFVEDVFMMKDNVTEISEMPLFMNAKHVPWFKEAYREKYGEQSDFQGEKMEVKDYPMPKIVAIPNMGATRFDMFIMPENAVEIHENKPGEFYAYYFQRDLENLMVCTYGKEGTFTFGGRKHATRAALEASNGADTNIFRNNPTTLLADGATTCNALVNEMFETVNNTGATAITDIVGAKQGNVYKILCGGTTNATTIAKTNKFSELTAAYIPTAVGDYLKVIYDPVDEKFLELERKVGGTIAVNASVKAPEYVA